MENIINYNEECIRCGCREFEVTEKKPGISFIWAFGLLGVAIASLFKDENNKQYNVTCKECGNVEVCTGKHIISEKHL